MKIGVFLCRCGPNIADRIDLDSLSEKIRVLKDVFLVHQENLPCSVGGKETVSKIIKENDLTHCVFASCSHRVHEKTFMKILEDGGLNPYLMEMANVREHCSWVTSDKKEAEKKAFSQILSAIEKVKTNEPLIKKEIEMKTAVAIIGGGISGIKAAKTIARDGRKVYLIDRSPTLGGRMPQWEKSFPTMECNPCFLAPEISELSEIENIEIITGAEITEIVGFYGNFVISLIQKGRGVNENCMVCGECSNACPVRLPDSFNYGMTSRGAIYVPFPGCLPSRAFIETDKCLKTKGEECNICFETCLFEAIDFELEEKKTKIFAGGIVLATGFAPDPLDTWLEGKWKDAEDVYSLPQLERMISTTGPTEQKILLKNNNEAKSVTLVHCAGRTGDCSRICCAASLKCAYYLKTHFPEMEVNILHHDLCLQGEGYQFLYDKTVKSGVNFYRTDNYESVKVSPKGKSVFYNDVNKTEKELISEAIFLVNGIVPEEDNGSLFEMLGVATDSRGFLVKNHGRMDPNATNVEGIFIAGCAGGPKDIQESVISAQGAGGEAVTKLVEGKKIVLELITSYVDEEKCSSCKTCIQVCPYKAVYYDELKKVTAVNEVLCKGCGTCVATCPSNAMKNHHFETESIKQQLKTLICGSGR